MSIIEQLSAREFGKRRRIFLMRHGSVSYFDASGRPVGSDSVPLNEMGRAQADAAGALLADTRFDRVVVSGLPRTLETAQRVLAQNKLAQPALETVEDLREIKGGKLAEIRDEEIEATFLQVFGKVSNFEGRFLGGETIGDFADRIVPAFRALFTDTSWNNMLLVLHGGSNRAILSHCLCGGARMFLGGLHQTPACVNLIDKGEADYDFVVRAMNIAPPDMLQTTSRKTTMEDLLEQYLAFRRNHDV
jgi:broad specificity phosphatase PhoE